MLDLRWYDGKLQEQDALGAWTDVPVVLNPDRAQPEMCPHCGAWYVNDHTCWIRGA